MNTSTVSSISSADLFRLFSFIKLCRHGNAPKIEGVIDRERHLSEKGRAQARSIAFKQQGERFDAVFASPFPRAIETARLVTGREDIVVLPSLDMSDDPSDPLNVMFTMLGYSPLSEYFKHDLCEHLRNYSMNAVVEFVAETAKVSRSGQRAKIFVSGHAVCQAAIARAIGEILTNDKIESGEKLVKRSLEINQGEAEVITLCFSSDSCDRAVWMSALSPSL